MPTITFTKHPETDPIANRWLGERGWTEHRRANAVGKLNAWIDFLEGRDRDLLDADASDLNDYLARRKRSKIAASTRHDDYRFITDLYAWAAADRRVVELADDPMVGVRAPHVPTKPATRAARADEVEQMEAYFMGLARQMRGRSGGERERALRNAAIVSVMFRSGPRSHEIAALDLDGYYCDEDLGWVLRLDITKTEEPRLIPIESRTQGFLEAYLRVRGREPGPLFLGRAGFTADEEDRLRPAGVQRAIRRAANACGVPVSSHQLRRGFVAEYIRRGGDTLTLSKIGGWTNERMPHRYFDADQATAVSMARYRDLMDADHQPHLRVVDAETAPKKARASRNPNLRRRA